MSGKARLWVALGLAMGLIGGLLWCLSEDVAATVEGRAIDEAPGHSILAMEVSGTISSNTTWVVGDSPYQLTADVTVNPGVTLTIEPGVVVQGGVGNERNIELKIQGHLEAVGEAVNPIIFTSYIDSRSGEWAGLIFDGGTGNLRHTVVRYGGGENSLDLISDAGRDRQGNIAVVGVRSGPVIIEASQIMTAGDNTLGDNKPDYGLYITNSHVIVSGTQFVGNGNNDKRDSALYVEGAQTTLTATGNMFTDTTGYAVRIPPALIENVVNNQFSGVETEARRIFIEGEEVVSDTTMTWQVGLQGYELGADLRVVSGTTLIINPDVTVMGAESELMVEGHLTAIGTATDPITFTSAEDSEPGEWSGVVFDGGIGDFKYAVVRYGGMLNSLGLRSNIAITDVLTGAVTIETSKIMSVGEKILGDKLTHGLYVMNSRVIISDTQFIENGQSKDYGLYVAGATTLLTATHNIFTGTMGYAVRIPPTLIGGVVENQFFGMEDNARRILVEGPEIIQDTTLTAQTGLLAYELGTTLVVTTDTTLSVEPGVAVRGGEELTVRGHLDAIGTATDPITFTSAEDSGPSQWSGLIFKGGTGDLQHTIVRYGGAEKSPGSGLRGNIAITSVLTGMVRIIDSTIAHESSGDPDAGLYVANSHAWISDTLFMANGNRTTRDYALYVDGMQSVLTATGNIFTGTRGYAVRIPPTLIGNLVANQFFGAEGEVNARRILVEGPEIIQDTTLTAQTGLLAYELGTTLVVTTDTTLSVEPGVAVRGGEELTVRGHLDAIGTATDPITFTSAGDSEPGQWSGLVFSGGTGDLQNATVRYGGAVNSLGVRSNIAITNVLSGEVSIGYSTIISGGHGWGTPREDYSIYLQDSHAIVANTDIYANGNDPNNDAALYIDGADSVITVTGSTVRDNDGVGVELNQGDLRFLCAEVSNNGSDGLRIDGGSLSILGSGLFGNGGFDLDNNTGEQIDATENWWGDSNGPSTGQIDGDVVSEPFLPVYVCVTYLEVTQTDAPYDPSLAGDVLTYTITVTNIGPASLPQLVISDTLDAGVRYMTGTVSQGTGCTEVTTGTVNCDLGAMAIGQTETATVQVKTDVEGEITNTIVAFSEGAEGLFPLSAPVTETTTLEPAADIWPSIQGRPDPAAMDFPLTYTVAVHNDGPSTAQDVTLTYTWPTSASLASVDGTCMHNGTTMTCTWEEMARDTVVSATVVVTPTAKGWLQSQAEVASPMEDWNLANDVITDELEVASSSDFSVTMGLAPAPPNYVSSPLTYTIVVTNDGPDALAAVVSDALPVSATFLSASPGCGAPVSGVVTCTLDAMTVGAQETLTVAVMAPPEVMTLTNHVEVVAQGSDPRPRNNVIELHTPLAPKADLRVTTLDAPAAVALDAPITYTIEISNAGPSTATQVYLTDTLSSKVIFNAVTPVGCFYDEGEHRVVCDLGVLAPGAGMSITIATTAMQSGPAENIVTVSAAEHDHVAGNNTRPVTTQVASVVDLHVTLSDDPDPVPAGERLTYTLVVANAGPDAATGVMLTNTLPVDVVYSSTETVQGTPFLAAPGVITYSLGTIPAGEAVTATVFVTVSPSARGTLEASATAIAAEDDLNAGNNRDIVEPTTVNAEADLSVGLIQVTVTVTAGQEFTYTVAVTNSGPSTAMAVVLTDTLPSALSYVGAEVSLVGGNCQAADVGISCTLGTMALHQTAWVTMTLATDPGASGQVVSTIAAASLESDPDMENNTLDIPTTILASAEGGTIYLPLVMRSSSP